MKVLLINPPYSAGYLGKRKIIPQHHPPLGLAYIASYLEKHYDSVTVKIIDCDPLSVNLEEAAKIAKNYDIVGITSLTPIIMNAWQLAKRIKEISRDTTVILGGVHASNLPDESLSKEGVDLVVRGEGEETMLEILQNVSNGGNLSEIKGISYKSNGEIRHNLERTPIRNLDELPFPARHLLPNDKYWTIGVMRTPWASIVTSRGCPQKCTFCSQAGGWWRYRSAKNVLDELDFLVDKYKIHEFDIIDDNFLVWKKRANEIMDGLLARKWDVIWRCSNGVRVDTVDKDLLEKMYKSGCRYLAFGVESGSQRILNTIRKNVTLDEIRSAFRWCREVGIKTTAFFMIGNLSEDYQTIMETIRFAKELKPDNAQFTITTPYPGSEMFDIVSANGKIYSTDWSKWTIYTQPLWELGNLKPEFLQKMHRKAYLMFTLRPRYLVTRLLKVGSYTELKGLIKGGLGLLSLLLETKPLNKNIN